MESVHAGALRTVSPRLRPHRRGDGTLAYIAPEALNCAAPDTGNMEILHLVGTREQKERWLQPLLDGTMRSGFSMTEPDVASSDARNIMTSIVRDGDEYIVNGRKWWTTGAADPRCEILVVMGKTNAEAEPHKQQSMILVPVATAGVEIVRSLPIFGYHDQHGHCEIRFDNVRVPATNMLASEGDGFAIAQARLVQAEFTTPCAASAWRSADWT